MIPNQIKNLYIENKTEKIDLSQNLKEFGAFPTTQTLIRGTGFRVITAVSNDSFIKYKFVEKFKKIFKRT